MFNFQSCAFTYVSQREKKNSKVMRSFLLRYVPSVDTVLMAGYNISPRQLILFCRCRSDAYKQNCLIKSNFGNVSAHIHIYVAFPVYQPPMAMHI